MTKRKISLFFCAFFLVLITASIATYLKSYTAHAKGRIVGIRVEIYQDVNATTLLTEIDWQFVEPNETKTYTCYVKSKSNVPAYLTLTTESWNPINASEYIFLTWNYDNSTLEPEELREITFSLYVDINVSGIDTFTFDIVVSAKKIGFGAS